MEKRQSDCTVVSKVKGTVKSVGDPEIHDGSPLVVLAGEEGFYLAGTISELQLESVGVGQEDQHPILDIRYGLYRDNHRDTGLSHLRK